MSFYRVFVIIDLNVILELLFLSTSVLYLKFLSRIALENQPCSIHIKVPFVPVAESQWEWKKAIRYLESNQSSLLLFSLNLSSVLWFCILNTRIFYFYFATWLKLYLIYFTSKIKLIMVVDNPILSLLYYIDVSICFRKIPFVLIYFLMGFLC